MQRAIGIFKRFVLKYDLIEMESVIALTIMQCELHKYMILPKWLA